MANLSKLDETIDQLEKQAELLKHNNTVLTKVSELSTSIEKGVNELSIGNKLFDETKKDIQNSLKSINDSIDNLEKQNEKHIDLLITSNKTFLREFEDSTNSKLTRFSSDIQVTIRQERTQLQDAIQIFLTNQFNLQNSKLKSQKVWIICIFIIALLMFIGISVLISLAWFK